MVSYCRLWGAWILPLPCSGDSTSILHSLYFNSAYRAVSFGLPLEKIQKAFYRQKALHLGMYLPCSASREARQGISDPLMAVGRMRELQLLQVETPTVRYRRTVQVQQPPKSFSCSARRMQPPLPDPVSVSWPAFRAAQSEAASYRAHMTRAGGREPTAAALYTSPNRGGRPWHARP